MPAPNSPILFIDNDSDDHSFVREALATLRHPYPLRSFFSAEEALVYLYKTTDQPFLILSDIAMREMNGLELRETIEAIPELKQKGIPFIILTDFATRTHIERAYELSVQGFYAKPHEYGKLAELLDRIICYWEDCLHPHHSAVPKV